MKPSIIFIHPFNEVLHPVFSVLHEEYALYWRGREAEIAICAPVERKMRGKEQDTSDI